MRYLKIGLLFLLLLPMVMVEAQDSTCELDISGVVSLLEEAQAKASDNDAGAARKLLLEAGAEIDTLVEGCKGDIQLSEEKTLAIRTDSTAGDLTFNYPVGWLTAEEQENFPNILIGSNSEALGKPLDGSSPPPFSSGEVLIAVGVADTGTMGTADALGKSPTPADFLHNMLTTANNELGTPSEPTSRAINDHPAAWVTYTGSRDFNMLIMLVDMQQKSVDGQTQYMVMIAITAADELASLEPTLEAMAATFRLKLKP